MLAALIAGISAMTTLRLTHTICQVILKNLINVMQAKGTFERKVWKFGVDFMLFRSLSISKLSNRLIFLIVSRLRKFISLPTHINYIHLISASYLIIPSFIKKFDIGSGVLGWNIKEFHTENS